MVFPTYELPFFGTTYTFNRIPIDGSTMRIGDIFNDIDFVTHNDITQKTSQLRQGQFSYLASSCLVAVLETVIQPVRYDSLHTELVSFNSTISKFN